MKSRVLSILIAVPAALAAGIAAGQDADLAKQLANPIAALISVPFQLNFDDDIGQDDAGDRWTMNFQPVIPIDFNEKYNIISRTILPFISQQDVAPGAGSQSGTGDIVQSFFFSPKTTQSGWIIGYGPVITLPTGTDDRLTSDKWGIGPTFVGLKQSGPWTYGALFNHVVSVAGDNSRPDVSATYIQPFLSYTTPTAVSYSVSADMTYDWKNDQASVPLNLSASKVLRMGQQVVSIGAGLRNWVNSTPNGPEGWGLRLTFTLLYPKG